MGILVNTIQKQVKVTCPLRNINHYNTRDMSRFSANSCKSLEYGGEWCQIVSDVKDVSSGITSGNFVKASLSGGILYSMNVGSAGEL